MKQSFRRVRPALMFCALLAFPGAGCNIDIDELEDLLEDIEININNAVNTIQTDDPRQIALPQPVVDRGNTIIINQTVNVIVDVSNQLVVEELPDITLIGFENITGFDIYLQYLVDGELQGVFVFDGETLLLEYPCLADIQLLSEEDFDVFSGIFIQEFDLSSVLLLNPFDFECGQAVILTIDPFSVSASTEIIELAP